MVAAPTMWKFLRSLFGLEPKPSSGSKASSGSDGRLGASEHPRATRPAAGWGGGGQDGESQPGRDADQGYEAPHGQDANPEDVAAPWNTPDPLPEIPSLDDEEAFKVICLDDEPEQTELEQRVQRRIETGRLSLSYLPSTSIAVMQLSSRPGASVDEIVETIEPDPVLSSELLKTANSILYGARVPTESIRGAVMRIGMRSLRTMILGFSMRSALLRTANLKAYGEKVWRQAFTVASIARSIAGRVGFEPEQAFLLGLLHDIGKLAILDTLSKELRDDTDLTPPLVGRLFMRYHELAGQRMAEAWKLSDEIVSVAGCHHQFEENEDFSRSAAFVSLCHRMELFLAMEADEEYQELAESPEFEVLGVPPGGRARLLALARGTYVALHGPAASDEDGEGNSELVPDVPTDGATAA